jgi:hypothetical protein
MVITRSDALNRLAIPDGSDLVTPDGSTPTTRGRVDEQHPDLTWRADSQGA